MLGSTGLSTQTVIVHIHDIDAEKLKAAIGGGRNAAFADLALTLADAAPKATLDIGLPIAEKELKLYGIDATLSASDVPTRARSKSEFWSGLAVGGVLGGSAWAIWRYALRPLIGMVTQ